VPSKPRHPSLTFRLRLSKVLSELESAVREASEGRWEEGDRQRSAEICWALSRACQSEGLREAAMAVRSMGCLMQLSREQILPIEAAFREKLQELLAALQSSAYRVLTGSG